MHLKIEDPYFININGIFLERHGFQRTDSLHKVAPGRQRRRRGRLGDAKVEECRASARFEA